MCIIIMGATMGKSGGNLLDSLPTTQGTLHVVMLGLDSAGKTTALYRLKFDQYLNTVPTIGFNCEKVRGAVGKAKGVQFLVWDVGGQEKLRPLWRSYTRCTDGIVFVVDSVDVERMEEAKMELMRTAKCPDNQGVPVLILANKQDLPGAREPKELEKLLGLHELSPLNPPIPTSISLTSTSSSSSKLLQQTQHQQQQQQQHHQHQQKDYDNMAQRQDTQDPEQCNTITATGTSGSTIISGPILSSSASSSSSSNTSNQQQQQLLQQQQQSLAQSSSSSITGTSSTSSSSSCGASGSGSVGVGVGVGVGTSSSLCQTVTPISSSHHQYQQQQQQQQQQQPFKGWYIQPACAITGEGLQEGLEALYDMIMKKRKLNKTNKKKRNKKKW